eukprot:4122630-Amphidinium_carterae.1
MIEQTRRKFRYKAKFRLTSGGVPSRTVEQKVVQSAGLFLAPRALSIELKDIGEPSSMPKSSSSSTRPDQRA